MEEDATATDMDEEYEDDKDDKDEEVVAEKVEPEGWVKHTKAASLFFGRNSYNLQ